ncbi:hypothetical protein [Leptotrichia buccalis]|mgnify:FL=1|jgi:hypothetical protein|uniref:Uncharacterized protein n=1 Tax=Leptotrichia buccalis (strain ATCC 14201 / DSM 1135 / JCM 12969 / NCTC 10249 / C-1013-b) TaxID=523794 RepID=C7NB17_LEPBD|nr:hypothetical protein [Leptotrichia buccalis]ACV39348.1 hypothetical protein Lebu_1473 [Leptotrichia buccalis C-1013-b]
MKAKKLLLCGIIAALSVPVMADSAQEALKNARDGYYKTLKETPRTKTEKLVTIDKEQGGVVEEKEIVKPKSQIEKLEYNMAKAKERIDFYERVVRSVQREEKELGDFDSVIKRDGIRKARKAKK